MSGFITTVTDAELWLLGAAVASIDIDETKGEAMHLRTAPGGRQWIVEADTGQLVIDVDDAEVTTTAGPLPLSERIRRFADMFDDDTLVLSLADDRTVVATSGEATAAIDLVATDVAPEPWDFRCDTAVTVGFRQFLGMLWSARCMPSGLSESSYPMPPMWMQVGDGWVGLHIDWTDFMPSRSTYRVRTIRHDGDATVAIPHFVLESFLRKIPDFDAADEPAELTVEIGIVERDRVARPAMQIRADSWRLTLWLVQPLVNRWAPKVDEELGELQVLDRGRGTWAIGGFRREVLLQLHHGHPDVVRVSAPLVGPVEETIDLLRELSALNAASTGVRFWLEDGVAHAAANRPASADSVRPLPRTALRRQIRPVTPRPTQPALNPMGRQSGVRLRHRGFMALRI
ncbi:MAG: hypothetical protein RL238_811 [Actinomycetota bacterium]|jgi:hypothetical protein